MATRADVKAAPAAVNDTISKLEALREKLGRATPLREVEREVGRPEFAPTRRGKKTLAGHFDPAVLYELDQSIAALKALPAAFNAAREVLERLPGQQLRAEQERDQLAKAMRDLFEHLSESQGLDHLSAAPPPTHRAAAIVQAGSDHEDGPGFDDTALEELLEQLEHLSAKVLADTEAEVEEARRFNVEMEKMLTAIRQTMEETDRRWQLAPQS